MLRTVPARQFTDGAFDCITLMHPFFEIAQFVDLGGVAVKDCDTDLSRWCD
jgi:hypothetical protein